MPQNDKAPPEAGEPKSSPPATNIPSPASPKAEAAVTTPATGPTPTPSPLPAPPAPSSIPPVSKRRFWINLSLFVVLEGIVASWFLWHMQRWFTGALFGGILVVIIPLVYGTFVSLGGDEMKALPAKMLGAPRSRTVLISLILASIVSFFLTSSVYIEYAPTGGENEDCTVEIVNASSSKQLMSPITVTSKDTVGGRPFFCRLFPTELRFKLVNSPGREQRIERLRLGKRILLRAPADFTAKQFHILRVVFGPRLWNNLAEPDDTVIVSYDLQIMIGDLTTQMADVRRQTIYLGASSEGVEYVLKHEDVIERKGDFVQRLAALGYPTEQQRVLADAWDSKRRVVPSEEHSSGEAIKIALRRRGTDLPIAREESKKTNLETIQTILLEMP